MGIDLKTTKMLWGRAAGRCAICRLQLFTDGTETDDSALIGEMCHIVAEKPDGPRGDKSFPSEKIDKYDNLILLCPNHHTEIDKRQVFFSIEKLRDIKARHEQWVRESLPGFDAVKQRDDETYADYVAHWEKACELDRWEAWSSHILSGQPEMLVTLDQQLFDQRRWLLTRIWPNRYPSLEAAFENFRRVLQDFQETFRKHAEKPFDAANVLMTKKFYHFPEWDPERYERLSKKYDEHVNLVEDLMLELTRASNHLCDEVRKNIYHSYRMREGRLAVMSGPYEVFKFMTFVPLYSKEEASNAIPYPGLEDFKKVLCTRDHHVSICK